jgi:hypothetical protein
VAGHRRAPSDPRLIERVRQGLREHESTRLSAVARREPPERPPALALSCDARRAAGTEAAAAP